MDPMERNGSKNRRIIIVFPDPEAIRDLIACGNLSARWRWMYLGRDPVVHREIGMVTGEPGNEIRFSERLQEVARKTRGDYIEYVGDLSARRASLAWWTSSLPEKNPFTSRFFLYSCYLKIVLEDCRSGEGDRIIVCETRGLREAVQRNATALPGITVEVPGPGSPRRPGRSGSFLPGMVQKIHFIGSMTARILVSHLLSGSPGGPPARRPDFLIYSWADTRSFPGGGSYRDIYCGILGEELRKKGRDVRYIVNVLPTISFLDSARRVRKFPNDLLLFEDLLSPLDPLRAALAVWWDRHDVVGSLEPFGGLQVGDLVREERGLERLAPAREKAYLCYLAGKRIGERFPCTCFIHPFEFHAWEKMFAASLRQYSPGSPVVGYAHSIVIPMYTCYSLSRAERAIAPRPDIILVNGPGAKSTLVRVGFEEERILIGGSFRYPALGMGATEPPVERRKQVLVALSPDFYEALELVITVIAALGDPGSIPVVIKAHPVLTREHLTPFFPVLPAHFAFSDAPVDHLLAQSGLVIYTVSTIAVEAVDRGIPVVHVKLARIIDRNIFEDVPRIPSTRSPGELKAVVRELLAGGQEIPREGKELVRELFAPVDGKVLDLLVKKGIPEKSPGSG